MGSEQLFVYHDAYTWSGRQIPEPLLAASYGRSSGVLQALVSAGLAPASHVHRPRALPVADLRRVHSQEYIDHVLHGRPAPPGDPTMSRRDIGALGPLKESLFGSWSQQRAQKTLLAAGGTYSAAHLALDRKSIVGNLAPGTHHVAKGSADGLAMFNGPVVAARKLIHEGAVQRVMIIDGDLNYGGGTSRLTAGDPSIAYVSVYGVPTGQPYRGGTNDARPVPRKATDAEYLATFSRGLAQQIDRFRPELIIYNASANPLRGDPVNATAKLQVSKEALGTRDALVFALARSRGVPVCWELGSGYRGDGTISAIHRNTAEAANSVLSLVRPGDRIRFAGASAWRARGGVVTFPRWSVGRHRAADLLGPPPSSTAPTD
jgi:acetoin utilization deacetylase AcuC-like enzyme